jgi:aspartate/methionine/tyrosine aminotransferase
MTGLRRDFALEVYFSRYEFTARFNLAGSDAESSSIRDLLALGDARDREAFESLRLGYTETFGAPELRHEIAGTYASATVDAQHVLTFAGAQEALYIVARVLLSPEDHVVVVTPNYQSAETMPLSICAATGIALDPDNHWRLDVNRLIDSLRPNTKLVSINFPNNPTGAIIPREDFSAVVEACRAKGVWLLSDEVYRLIEGDVRRRLPQAADVYAWVTHRLDRLPG